MSTVTYPLPTGPHSVGVADGAAGELPLRIWYPAVAGTGLPRQGDVEVFRAYPHVNPEWMEQLALAAASARQDATPSPGAWPVFLYSHGAQGFIDQSVTLMQELASHGYLVVAFAHPGGACAARHLDGSVTPLDDAFTAEVSSIVPAMFAAFASDLPARVEFAKGDWGAAGARYEQWVQDFRTVLDALHDRTVAGPAQSACEHADLTRVGAGGFSFSGAAAPLAAHRDDRIHAAINMDGGDWSPELIDAEIRTPTLAIATDQAKNISLLLGVQMQIIDFHELSYERLASIGTRSDVHRFVIDGPAHQELTDVVLVPREARMVFPGNGEVDADASLPIVNALVRGFLDRYLRAAGEFPGDVLPLPGVREVDLSAVRSQTNLTSSAR